jgi:O-antigen ligase
MVWRVAFAVLVSSSALMILGAWATGSASNPVLTAALLAGAPAVMIAGGRFSEFRIGLVDILFGLFVAAALISTAINGLPPAREAGLFALSLLAYPAGRLVPMGTSFRPFLIVTLLVVGIGTIAVGAALVGQWNDPHGRPIVFGFAHAATVFLTSLGFLMLAVVCLDDFRRPVLSAVAAVPALVIFAASQVRFTFVAIAGSLWMAFLVSGPGRRRGTAAVLGLVIASVVIGLAVRPHTSGTFLKYIISAAAAAERPQNPVAGECGELDNSVAIRKTLLRQAVQALPSAGLFGHGLSSMAQRSCFKMDPHNSVLQAVLEFGWIGGALLVLLVAAALRRLWPVAVENPEAAFVLCCLSHVAMIDMAHGHLATDGLLFLFIGYAARASIWVKS